MSCMFLKPYSRLHDWYTDNDVVAMIPEFWAFETLRALRNRTVALPLVNRDYQPYFQKAGDVVNVHRPLPFEAKRKQKGSTVTVQDTDATADTVKLDQHFHVSFYLDDQDERATFRDLQEMYIEQAAIAISDAIDFVILGEVYQFVDNVAGNVDADITDQYMRDLAEVMTRNNVPRNGRNLIIGPASENQILGVDRFVESCMIGDGAAIKTNQIGHVRGFDVMTASQPPEVGVGSTTVAGAVNNAGGYPAGTATLTTNGGSFSVTAGEWCLIAGDMQPHRLTAVTGDPATSITIDPPLAYPVAHTGVITAYTAGAIDHPTAGTYAAAYSDEIQVDGFSAGTGPYVGQGVSIGNSGTVYTVIGITLTGTSVTKILLNRPLEAAAADGAIVCPLPKGNYNMAFIRDAITFVNRPLKPSEAGVRAALAAFGGLGLRATIGYDMDYMGTKVTIDTLCGVKTLNKNMGAILVS